MAIALACLLALPAAASAATQPSFSTANGGEATYRQGGTDSVSLTLRRSSGGTWRLVRAQVDGQNAGGSSLSSTTPQPLQASTERKWQEWRTPPPPPKRCANGLDDDNDGAVDLADPGCTDAQDDNEANIPLLGREGEVRVAKPHESDMDPYLTAALNDPARRQFWVDHYDRLRVYDFPLMRNQASWLPDSWAYQDAYAIYKQANGLPTNDRYVLRDANGNRLFIAWGCSGGTCPQFAANVCDQAWQDEFIARARVTAAAYGGTFMDDANVARMVSNGSGALVTPVNYVDGTTLTETEWGECMARFIERVKAGTAPFELVGNTVWFHAGGVSNPNVQRAIRAMDVWEIERGFNDPNVTPAQFETLVNAIDWAHSQGVGVVLDVQTATGEQYALGTYLLVSNGEDYVGGPRMYPDNWWAGWDTNLGAALEKARKLADGRWQRRFERGTVTVDPQARTAQIG